MVTRGRMVIAEAGETVLFDCAFHADQYNLFDYPVLWLKEQRLEETQMNVMGNLNEPFSSTDRIQVKMEVGADGEDKLYNVFLRISGEDYSLHLLVWCVLNTRVFWNFPLCDVLNIKKN